MTVERPQTNLPLVGPDGKPTVVGQQFLEKLVAEVIALRAKVDEYETRISALEP